MKGLVQYLFILSLIMPYFHRHDHVHVCSSEVNHHSHDIGTHSAISILDTDGSCEICSFLLSSKKVFSNSDSSNSQVNILAFQSQLNEIVLKPIIYYKNSNRAPPAQVWV